MDYNPLGPFVTSLIEVKLDWSTMFEWQGNTQENLDVPHYTEILKFIDLQARASEMVVCEPPKCHTQSTSKSDTPIRTTYVVNAVTACMSCGVGKHPLYVCKKFKSVSTEQRMKLVREHQPCFNCLKCGHFLPQSASNPKCQKCHHKPHRKLLHSSFECNGVVKRADQDAKKTLPAKGMTLVQVTALTSPAQILVDSRARL